MKYVLKKTGHAILTILGLATLLFVLLQAMPADPARMMLDQREDEAQLAVIRHKYGFDRSKWAQYFYYVNDLSPLSLNSNHAQDFTYPGEKYGYVPLINFGKVSLILKAPYLRESFQRQGEPVSSIIFRTLPNTIILAVISMAFAVAAGLFFGVLSALHRNSLFERGVSIFGSLGMSVPSFFAAILMAWLFAYLLHDYTGLPMTGNLFEVDAYGEGTVLVAAAIILPALTLGIRPLAVIIQLVRNSLLDEMGKQYILTARAKGLSMRQATIRHALRNAMNPVITAVSGWFAGMLAGSVFIEIIFGWNGLGKTIVDALGSLDLPVLMGSILVISTIFILINTLVDIAYGWLDPRVRK